MPYSRSTPLLVANWKMNLDGQRGEVLARAVAEAASRHVDTAEVILAPPFPYIERVAAALLGSPVGLAAQDLHWENSGPFTGAVSAAMLADAGASHVLVGHSERRRIFGDDDNDVARKLTAARDGGLTPILCVGENLEQRDAGEALEVVAQQLDRALSPMGDSAAEDCVVAYEPVWAIGTGRVAGVDEAAEVHAAIHRQLGSEVRVLYGGSVTPDSATGLLAEPEIDGVLVGSASLTAPSFVAIIAATAAAVP